MIIKYILLYFSLLPVFFAIDFLWLGYIAKNFYFQQLDHLIAKPIKAEIAMVFYLIFIIGILLFAVLPAYKMGSWSHALIWGALFGFFTYSTYDLTNWATIRDWPWKVVFVDIVWGTVLCASVALIGFYIASHWIKP